MLSPAKDGVDIGLLVKDAQACLSFYRDTLGFEYIGQVEVPQGVLHRLRWGSSDLKLLQPTRSLAAGPLGHRTQLGFRYITLVINDLASAHRELTAAGVPFSGPPQEIRPGVRVAFMQDPEGNTVELQEIDK